MDVRYIHVFISVNGRFIYVEKNNFVHLKQQKYNPYFKGYLNT